MKRLLAILFLCSSVFASETYRVAASGQTPLTSGINVTLCGSATRKVRLTRLVFDLRNSSATAIWLGSLQLTKRSTADSGGTCTTPTVVSMDSSNTTASATFVRTNCTVAITPGTSAGLMTSRGFATETAAGLSGIYTVDFVSAGVTTGAPLSIPQAVILNGTTQCVDITFPANAGTPLYDLTMEWIEE